VAVVAVVAVVVAGLSLKVDDLTVEKNGIVKGLTECNNDKKKTTPNKAAAITLVVAGA